MNVAMFCEASRFHVMEGSKSYVVTLETASPCEAWTAIITSTEMRIRHAGRTTEPKVVKEVAAPSMIEADLVACYYAGVLVRFADARNLDRGTFAGFAPPKCSAKPRCIVMRCIAFCEGMDHAIFGTERCNLVHCSASVAVYVCGDHFIEFVFLSDAARIVYRCGHRAQTVSMLYAGRLTCNAEGRWSAPDSDLDELVRSVEGTMRAELSIFPVFGGGAKNRAYTVQCPGPSSSNPGPI